MSMFDAPPWIKNPRRVRVGAVPTWTANSAAAFADAAAAGRAAEAANIRDKCEPQRVGRTADDPTYCCEACEVLTELTGRVKALESAVADLAEQLGVRRGGGT